jgi:peptidoglycan/xylan/chitin deacetylase (PgdA/CDA1 family)
MFHVTLSFDNGPEPDATPGVLEVLARHGIRATFFVIGEKLRDPARRALAARAHAEGHWIGNHTFSHTVPLGLRAEPDAAEREIGQAQEALGDLAHPDRLFRPMGGGGHLDGRLLSPSALEFLVRGRYSCVLWNAIPRDWQDPEGWAERAAGQCRAQPWTLLVLHDLPTGAMAHLDGFLARLEDDGARFRQDFPPDCVPLRRGDIVRPLEAYVSGPIGRLAS